ncbi:MULTISPECIES: fatty acid desaturase [Aphanothece]|uniref:fatty acid desaturase n=1 Tax=Aphanothece TaxID=1121 RepID=UPI003984F6A2
MLQADAVIPTRYGGLLPAAAIVLGWLITLVSLLRLEVLELAFPLLALAVLGRTMLQTGLFIVGHDAMHGVLLPDHPRWNIRLGALCLGLYAALPYGPCQRNHHQHHQAEATPGDPDFHPDPQAGLLRWYLRFMGGYLSPRQMGRLLGGWALLGLFCRLGGAHSWSSACTTVLLLCTLPLLLSSLQLFAFGTYLPHRHQRAGSAGRNGQGAAATSLDLPVWASLLACYHFGYHREHHEQPSLPWFALPQHRLAAGRGTSVALNTRSSRDAPTPWRPRWRAGLKPNSRSPVMPSTVPTAERSTS